MYLLKIKIDSDSGVGPFTEIKYVSNCKYKEGEWYNQDNKKVVDLYSTNFADCIVTVMEFKEQEGWYH